MEMTRDVSKDIGLLRGCDQGLGPRWCTIDTWDRILDPWLCMAWRRKQKLPRPGTLHWVFWNEPSEDGTKPYFVEVLQVSYLSLFLLLCDRYGGSNGHHECGMNIKTSRMHSWTAFHWHLRYYPEYDYYDSTATPLPEIPWSNVLMTT